MGTPVVPPSPTIPHAPDLRPFPIPGLRGRIEESLNALDAHTAIVVVDSDIKNYANAAVMVNAGGGWTFAGWLEHDIKTRDNSLGFEVRKTW